MDSGQEASKLVPKSATVMPVQTVAALRHRQCKRRALPRLSLHCLFFASFSTASPSMLYYIIGVQ